jgi:DNA-binding NtrC family response regulator
MAAGGALRVLVVDGDSLMRWALGCTLIQHGCIVVEEKDATSAIRFLADRANVVDVILLDFPLPGGDGFEVFTTLKHLAPRSNVLLMSADFSADDLAEAARRGASAFVPKPFDLDDMWMVLRATAVGRTA